MLPELFRLIDEGLESVIVAFIQKFSFLVEDISYTGYLEVRAYETAELYHDIVEMAQRSYPSETSCRDGDEPEGLVLVLRVKVVQRSLEDTREGMVVLRRRDDYEIRFFDFLGELLRTLRDWLLVVYVGTVAERRELRLCQVEDLSFMTFFLEGLIDVMGCVNGFYAISCC